mgnify:CR=1 FL=1
MPRFILPIIRIGGLPVLLLLLAGCTQEEPFFPVDPSQLAVTAVQVDNSNVAEGREGVKVDAQFTLIFSAPVDPALASAAIRLASTQEAAPLELTFNTNNSIVAIIPADSLAFETEYTLSVTPGELGAEGQTLATEFRRTFSTEIEPKPLFASGTGEESDPYVIETAEQVDLIRLFLESAFVLGADVDLSDLSAADPQGFAPLGDLVEGFSGTFDGADFTISGLSIARPDQTEVGLFGVLDGGTIRNLKLEVTGVEGNQATGALVGRQLDGLIENCHTSGSVTCSSSRSGGIIGSQEAGLLTRSSSSCGVNGSASRVGGLVGLSEAGTVSESYATGNCQSGSARVGGVVGSVEAGATVIDCYATGNMTGSNRTGGAVGRLDGSFLRGYATGNVTVNDADESGDYPGHVIGQIGSSSTYQDLYYPADQTINYAGGADITTDGTPVNIASYSCADPGATLAGFDFSAVWSCTADGVWPLLSWQ